MTLASFTVALVFSQVLTNNLTLASGPVAISSTGVTGQVLKQLDSWVYRGFAL